MTRHNILNFWHRHFLHNQQASLEEKERRKKKDKQTYVTVRALIDDFEVEVDKSWDGLYWDQEPGLFFPELCEVV